ncbi:MAG: adenosylcobinamide kinase/adenosylcobinamide phosphate guanyltransferase [Spirochaetes bacterium]|nr:MAG: adenosylcobinamide kinase/adenosylcobinamide phosphate guanyltransferase [Spirochaetota bacterium]
MKIMVTGGVRSGKSSFALELAEKYFKKKNFLATAIPFDEEMKRRIEQHKRERGEEYNTIEESIEIDKWACEDIILDCITLWMNNIFYFKREKDWEGILTKFLDNLKENAVIVTNETGLGNIPADPLTRKYNDYMGKANVLIASRMDWVYMLISGIPLRIK